MRFVLIIAFTLSLLTPAFAGAPPTAEQVEMRAQEVGRSLRCVVCQNQSIDESDAPLAADMRRLVRVQIAGGSTNEEVIDFMRTQYGDYVLLKPPVQGNTLVLWLAPLGLVLLALGWLTVNARRQIRPEIAGLSDDEAARLKALLPNDSEGPRS